METDSQDSKEEKPNADESSSNIEDNIDSTSQLNTEESKPIKSQTIEPTKTGEIQDKFANGDGARQLFKFYFVCFLHSA